MDKVRSMTGFGRGEAQTSDVGVIVELKSVNNRFRDLQLRSPREYLPLEPRMIRLLKDRFARGRIDCYIRRTAAGRKQRVLADADLAQQYQQAISVVEAAIGASPGSLVSSYILSQPGVLTVDDFEVDVANEWTVVEAALLSATEDLEQMREREGVALTSDLAHHLTELRGCLAEVNEATDGINERLEAKLQARLRRLLGDRVDPQRLAQEVAILADKADVAEEVARLRSHADQFAETLEQGGAIGRRLDFLLQEMNREVNTIGSKAIEHPVSHRVVEMKSVLERMREQSANVE